MVGNKNFLYLLYFTLLGPAGEMMLQSSITYMIDKQNDQLRRTTADTVTSLAKCAPARRTAEETRTSTITILVAVLAVRAADRTHRDRLRQRMRENFNPGKGDNKTSSLSLSTKLLFFLPKFATVEQNQKAGIFNYCNGQISYLGSDSSL
jgi:hypothetical protein